LGRRADCPTFAEVLRAFDSHPDMPGLIAGGVERQSFARRAKLIQCIL
jgi:hypothetical protein